MVLGFVGLPPSTYYAFKARQAAQTHNEPPDGPSLDTQGSSRCGGSPMSSCCRTHDGKIVSNEQVKEWLSELGCGDGFPYGYRKLTVCLREDYGLIINHKKVYRLCKELGVLLPQRKVSLKS